MSWIRRGAGVSALALTMWAGCAQAGILEDDEARKAILDLRVKLEALKQDQVKQAAEQAEQVQQVRRALIDMNNLIEQLRMELANVRGGNEQAMRDISELQRRFRDVQVGLDQRLVKLEPAKVVLDGREFLADPEEKRSYDAAVEQFRRGDFAEAAKSLQAFQRRYPQSGYSDSVWFWLGNAHFGKRDYREAVMAFRTLVSTSPQHARAAEALYSVASCQIELKDLKAAKRTLEDLLKTYPSSEVAPDAKAKLAVLK